MTGLDPIEEPGDITAWQASSVEGNEMYSVNVQRKKDSGNAASLESYGMDQAIDVGQWVVSTWESSSVDLVNDVAKCIKRIKKR